MGKSILFKTCGPTTFSFLWLLRYKTPRFSEFRKKSVYPLYICMYVCHLNFIENLPILGPYYGNTINDRDLCFCMLARYMLKAKTVQYEVLNRLGSWFSRYPIFKVYTIMYNSAGRFSTNVETTIFKTRFPTRSPFFIEQEANAF